jgi:hypothetical protein
MAIDNAQAVDGDFDAVLPILGVEAWGDDHPNIIVF